MLVPQLSLLLLHLLLLFNNHTANMPLRNLERAQETSVANLGVGANCRQGQGHTEIGRADEFAVRRDPLSRAMNYGKYREQFLDL